MRRARQDLTCPVRGQSHALHGTLSTPGECLLVLCTCVHGPSMSNHDTRLFPQTREVPDLGGKISSSTYHIQRHRTQEACRTRQTEPSLPCSRRENRISQFASTGSICPSFQQRKQCSIVRVGVLVSIEVVSGRSHCLLGRSNSIEQPQRLGGPEVPILLYYVIQEA